MCTIVRLTCDYPVYRYNGSFIDEKVRQDSAGLVEKRLIFPKLWLCMEEQLMDVPFFHVIKR